MKNYELQSDERQFPDGAAILRSIDPAKGWFVGIPNGDVLLDPDSDDVLYFATLDEAQAALDAFRLAAPVEAGQC